MTKFRAPFYPHSIIHGQDKGRAAVIDWYGRQVCVFATYRQAIEHAEKMNEDARNLRPINFD